MFHSHGRSEVVTRIVGDINATLVRKLEDLEHRVLMRIENLQRYEETTMTALTTRVDALERSNASLHFQNEMIQDELDELERLLLREFTKTEMGAAFSGTFNKMPSSAQSKHSANTSLYSQNEPRLIARRFAKRLFQKEFMRNDIFGRVVHAMAHRIIAEREQMMLVADRIAKNCGSPMLITNKRKLLRSFVLHMAACIISEQKKRFQRARDNQREKVQNAWKKLTDVSPRNSSPRDCSTPNRRQRFFSDQGDMIDLSQYGYGSSRNSSLRRVYSRPLKPLTPEPKPNPNVQRRPWSGKYPLQEESNEQRQATYRFPSIRKYANMGRGKWASAENVTSDLIRIED